MLSLEGDKRGREYKVNKQTQLLDSKKTFKTSVSLQNINDSFTVNTNNDFDQNTILQPENLLLLNKQLKPMEKKLNKSEVDLIETIGGIWSGTTEQDKLPSYSNLKKTLNIDNNTHSNTTDRSTSYRSAITKNFSNVSKTLPKKSKLLNKDNRSPTSKSNFYIGNKLDLLILKAKIFVLFLVIAYLNLVKLSECKSFSRSACSIDVFIIKRETFLKIDVTLPVFF